MKALFNSNYARETLTMPTDIKSRPEELVPVETVHGQITADIHKAVLEDHGIMVFYRSQTITNPSIRYVNTGPMGEITLLVPAHQLDEATYILKGMKDSVSDGEEYFPPRFPIRPLVLALLVILALPLLAAVVRIWNAFRP